MSGSAKLVAIGITYPYQVIRSRIQVRLAILSQSSSLILTPPLCLVQINDRGSLHVDTQLRSSDLRV